MADNWVNSNMELNFSKVHVIKTIVTRNYFKIILIFKLNKNTSVVNFCITEKKLAYFLCVDELDECN